MKWLLKNLDDIHFRCISQRKIFFHLNKNWVNPWKCWCDTYTKFSDNFSLLLHQSFQALNWIQFSRKVFFWFVIDSTFHGNDLKFWKILGPSKGFSFIFFYMKKRIFESFCQMLDEEWVVAGEQIKWDWLRPFQIKFFFFSYCY